MTFKDAISKIEIPSSGCIVSTDDLGYWNFNIDFINNEGQSDQTQFDILPAHFDYIQKQCQELQDLWKEFCKENGFKQNSIVKITLENL